MSDQFIGQIMPAAFNFAPRYFAQCNGALLPISQNQALFSLLGTTYGGDGIQTFGLPDLRGRTPIGMGGSYAIGEKAGVESVSLLASQIPTHTHGVNGCNQPAAARSPAAGFFGNTASTSLYAPSGPQVALNANTVGASGGSQPHPNMQPYSVLNFCIALSGVFPSRN